MPESGEAMRPICVCCGKPYGRRRATTESVKWLDGESKPEYQGNGIVLKERYHTKTGTRALLERFHHKVPNDYVDNQHIAYRKIWDGESWWGGYEPFCTLRCAFDYARKAYARASKPESRWSNERCALCGEHPDLLITICPEPNI